MNVLPVVVADSITTAFSVATREGCLVASVYPEHYRLVVSYGIHHAASSLKIAIVRVGN